MSGDRHPERPEVERIDGRLHFVHEVRDAQGNIIKTVRGPLKVEFRLEDFHLQRTERLHLLWPCL